MEVQRIDEQLWRWTGHHPEWRREVASVFYTAEGSIVLIDPIVPPEDRDRFLTALDRDVERAGGPVHVLITVHWHARSAGEIIARYQAALWASSRARAAVARRAGPVTYPFRPGDPLPAGITAVASGKASEVVYWLPAGRAVVVGDAIVGDETAGLRLCPASWLSRPGSHQRMRVALRRLLDLRPQRVLVSHGPPVLAGGTAALRRLLDA